MDSSKPIRTEVEVSSANATASDSVDVIKIAETIVQRLPGQPEAPALDRLNLIAARRRARFMLLQTLYDLAKGEAGRHIELWQINEKLQIDDDLVLSAAAYVSAIGYAEREIVQHSDSIALTPSGIDTVERAIENPDAGSFGLGTLRDATALLDACKVVMDCRDAAREARIKADEEMWLKRSKVSATASLKRG